MLLAWLPMHKSSSRVFFGHVKLATVLHFMRSESDGEKKLCADIGGNKAELLGITNLPISTQLLRLSLESFC